MRHLGVGGLALVLLVRAMRPREREEMDTVINVAVARKQPEVDAIAARIQARALSELSVEEREHIVGVRTSWLGDPLSADVPAGGMIIGAFLSAWNPYRR